MKSTASFLIILCLSAVSGFAQQQTAQISGTVTSPEGPLPSVMVYIKNLSLATQTNSNGTYTLTVPAGKHNLQFRLIGYEEKSVPLTLAQGEQKDINVLLHEVVAQLNEVEISAQAIEQIKESPYNVVALDAKPLHNSTMDVSGMLNKASGVKIRSSGGMGSSMSISLNGFTGRRVKVFMDGVPMSGFGAAFQLNNIPVSIANRIEVYKGVVPIEFGSDAIGGAINIVTNQSANTYFDASYSYGSFNTHKGSISVGHTTKNGFSFQLNSFINYSDNDYKVHLDKMLNVSTGQYIWGDYTARRFHDAYKNQTVMAKIGFIKKPWADRIFLGFTTGKVEQDVQNASTMEVVYGAITQSAATFLPSLEYYKRDFLTKHLSLRLTGNYNYNYNENVDTTSRLYNWYGEFTKTRTKGEKGINTLSKYKNKNYSSTANISYKLNKHHSFIANDVITGYTRKASNSVPAEELSAADTMRRVSLKNVLGLSYVYRPNSKWNINLFWKNYYQHIIGPVDTATVGNSSHYEEQERSFQTSGYGIALTRFLNDDIQIKASVEKAYKLPSGQQLFGDENLTTSNASLKAENSTNVNLGASINKALHEKHVLYADISGYYRLNKDFIRQVQDAKYATMNNVNFGRVRNIGVDMELRYYYKNKLMIGGTATYMSLLNKEKYRDAQSTVQSPFYDNRMPNIPYFYGNTDAVYYAHNLWRKGNTLTINYTFNFVGKFYLLWESQGNGNNKATLPKQLYHDLSISYSMSKQRYNLSLEALNFTDASLYDNFSLQKPGRSFNVKVSYHFVKKN